MRRRARQMSSSLPPARPVTFRFADWEALAPGFDERVDFPSCDARSRCGGCCGRSTRSPRLRTGGAMRTAGRSTPWSTCEIALLSSSFSRQGKRVSARAAAVPIGQRHLRRRAWDWAVEADGRSSCGVVGCFRRWSKWCESSIPEVWVTGPADGRTSRTHQWRNRAPVLTGLALLKPRLHSPRCRAPSTGPACQVPAHDTGRCTDASDKSAGCAGAGALGRPAHNLELRLNIRSSGSANWRSNSQPSEGRGWPISPQREVRRETGWLSAA